MKQWAMVAIVNMLLALVFVGCIHNIVIVTPDNAEKKIEATDKKTNVTYYNESPKVEVKNEVKPVGQVQTFEGFDPEKVPAITELGE